MSFPLNQLSTGSQGPGTANAVEENAETLFLGMLFNSGGLGVLSVQLCVYYLSFPQDSPRFKILVYGVYAVEVVQTALLCKSLFRSFVYGFFDNYALDEIRDLWFSIPVLGGLVSFLVQIFYAYRIIALWRMRRSSGTKIVVSAVITLAIAQMGGGLALGVELKNAVIFSRIKTTRIRLAAGIWYAGEAIGDILIAISMTYILLCTGNEGSSSTRKITRRLIRLTIETGTLTAAMSIITIVLVMFGGRKSYYQITAGVVSKLYSNTLLASLNGRAEAAADILNFDTHAGANISRLTFDFGTNRHRQAQYSLDYDGLTDTT